MKKIILVSLISVMIAACFGGCSNDTEMSNPKYVAHRGFSSQNPDNTAQSFSAASAMDFYGIETDIRMTKDGYLVCNHNVDVEYSDGTKLVISESNYADLIAKPIKNTKTSTDAYICPFYEYLDICKSGGKIAVVELKDVFTTEMIAKVFEVIDSHYDRQHCLFIAFDFDSLLRVREYDSKADIQYLSSNKRDKNLKKCLQQNISVDIHFSICTKKLVRQFHEKGLVVQVWTVDTADEINRDRTMGVDCITSNVHDKNP